MKMKVRIFAGDTLINPTDVPNIKINNPTIDRIVNDIVERNSEVFMDVN